MYYFKQTVFVFLYVLLSSLTAFAITYIPMLLLKLPLLIVNFILFTIIIVNNFYREGQVAMKIRRNNDKVRQKIAQTGEDLPIKRQAEYRTYKGYLIGAMVFIPCIALLLIHTVVALCGGGNFIGTVVSIGYMLFFWIYVLLGQAVTSPWTYFIVLWGIVYIAVISGIAFTVGAKKQTQIYNKMEEMHKKYGEEN